MYRIIVSLLLYTTIIVSSFGAFFMIGMGRLPRRGLLILACAIVIENFFRLLPLLRLERLRQRLRTEGRTEKELETLFLKSPTGPLVSRSFLLMVSTACALGLLVRWIRS